MIDRFTDKIIRFRDFLFGTFNREFLIFLFFLVLSAAYWLMLVLNDSMERDIEVPVQLVGVPQNVVVTSDTAMTVRVTVRDKGFTMMAYYYGDRISKVRIPFAVYASENNKCTVSNSDLQKMVSQQLYTSTRIVACNPGKLEFMFSYGKPKRVPVKLSGAVRASDQYYVANVRFEPDYVNVYSSHQLLDSISAAYTENINLKDIKDTMRVSVPLKRIKNSKVVPSKVTMIISPDIFVEATISVPITPVHFPTGAVLRTFPSAVDVHYVIGASKYKEIDSNQFVVTADYETTQGGSLDKCQLKLTQSPRDARNPRLAVQQVDYLLEQ